MRRDTDEHLSGVWFVSAKTAAAAAIWGGLIACTQQAPGAQWMTLGPIDEYELGRVYREQRRPRGDRGGPPAEPEACFCF